MRGKKAKTQINEKDSSSVPRSFFKVMYGDFKESLKIPPCFAPHVTQMVGKQISLKTYIRSFKCKMERDKDSKCFIKRGWSSLLRAHSIYEGCFLTFKMKSDASFSVRIYGQSALEWGSVGTVETGTSAGTGLVGDEARERWKYEEGTPSKGRSCKRGRKSRTTSNFGSSESISTDQEQNESEYNEREQTTSEDSSYEEKEREKVQEKERQMRRVKRERREDEAGTSSKGRSSKRGRTISKVSHYKSNYKNEEEKCGSDFRNEEELELHEEKNEIECLNLDEELHEKESGFDSLDGDSSKEREEEEEEKDKELETTVFEEEKGKKSEVANEKEVQKSNDQTETSEEPRRSMLLYKKDIPKFFGHLFVKYLRKTILDKPNCSTVETCGSKRQSSTSLVPNEAQQTKRLKMDEKESGFASSSSEGDTFMDHHESYSADQEENTSEKLEEELEEEVDCESTEGNKCERAEIGCEKEKEIGEEECQIEEIESLDGDKSERSADFEYERDDFESMEKEPEEKIADFESERANNFESMEKELEEKEERADFASIEKNQCERAEYGCEKEKEVAEEECEIEEFESLNGDKYERAHIEIQEGEKEGEFDNFELMDGDQCKISEIESEERNEEGKEEILELVSESEDELKKNDKESEDELMENEKENEDELTENEKEIGHELEENEKEIIISDSDEERETDANGKKEIIEEITQDVKEKKAEKSVYPVNFLVSCENLERENEGLNPFKQVNDLDYESETEKEEGKTLISPVREKEILEPTEKLVNNSDSELNLNESIVLAELELKNREKGKEIKCFIISDSDRERESDAIEKKEIIEEITQDVNSESSDEIDWKQLELETETEIENESNLGFQNVNSESSDEIDWEQFKAEIESESNLGFQNETRVVRYENGEIRSKNISNSEDCEEDFHISYRNPSLENCQLFLESSDDEEGCNSEDLSEKEADKTLNTIGIDMINEGNTLESGEDQSGNCNNEPGTNLEFPPENQDLKVVAIQGDKFETGNDAFDGTNLEIASENQDPFESGVNLEIPSQNQDPVPEIECENQEIEKSQVTVSTCTGEDVCDSGANSEIPPENQDQETKGMFCNTSIITDRDKQESGKDISAENQDFEKEGTTCVDLAKKGYTCEQRANMEIPDETQEKETEGSDCVDTTKNRDECEPGAESVISSEIQGFEIPLVTGNDVYDASSLKISYEDQNPESSEFMKDVNVNLLEPGANMEIYAELQDLEAGNDLACGKNSDIPFEDQDINQPQITVSSCNVDGENVLCDSGAKPEIPLQNQDNMDIVNDGDKHESGNDVFNGSILKIPTEDQNPERTEFMISINTVQDVDQLGPGANMEIHAEHHDPTLGNEISSEYQNIEQAQVTDSTYIFKGEDIFDAGVNLEIISENHDHETEGLVCNMDITTDRDIHDTGKDVLDENQGLELEAITFMDLLNNEDASEQSTNSEIPAENQDEDNYELVTKRMAGINLNIPSENQDAEPINKVYNYMDLIKSIEACEPVSNPVIMFENQDESGVKSVILSENQGLELALVSMGEEVTFESGGNNQELLLIANKGHESQQEVCLDIVAQEDPNSEAPISIVRPYESGKLHIVPVQEERPLVVARPEIQGNYVLLPNPFNITFSIESNNSEWIKLLNKLPNSVHKKKGGKKIVSLRDPCMREWPVLYIETKSFIGFTFGWDRFAKVNKIAEGDICRLYEVGCEFGDHYQVDIQKTLLSYQTSCPILYTRRKEAK